MSLSPDLPPDDPGSTFRIFRSLGLWSGIGRGRVTWLVALGLIAALSDALVVTLVVALLFALLSTSPAAGMPGWTLGVIEQTLGRDWIGLTSGLVLLVLVKVTLGFSYQAFVIRFKNDINARVLAAIHARLLDMPYPDLRSRAQGDLLNISARESWQVANAGYLLCRMAINTCTIIVFGLLVTATSWIVAVTAMGGVTLVAVSSRRLARHARAASLRARASTNRLYLQVLAAVQDARLIRAFSAERRQKQVFQSQVGVLQRDLARAETLQSLAGPIGELTYVILLLALVGIARAMSVPDVAALTGVALIYRMAPHARELENNRHAFAALHAPLSAVLDLLTPREPAVQRASVALPIHDGAIEFDRVSHRPTEGGARVLHEVSFSIRAGETTVLSGPSGAGKTSIVNLLLRLYEPESGAIRIGTTDLRTVARADWLAGVAVAGQDMDVLEGTIADNIRLGAPDASIQHVRDAAAVAGALDFIDALPDGVDTWVGAFGHNLSGGQRQRISIARAVLRQPRLLILDESTNAIEDTLEERVLRGLRARLPRAAILIITHRPSDACQADHVVRIEHGRVVTGPRPATTALCS